MSNFEKIIIGFFDIIVLSVLMYGMVNGNNWNSFGTRILSVSSLMMNLLLVEYLIAVINKKER